MSTNNYILNLLKIKYKNLNILNNEPYFIKYNNKDYKIIEGIIKYKPEYCPVCGYINNSKDDIIK